MRSIFLTFNLLTFLLVHFTFIFVVPINIIVVIKTLLNCIDFIFNQLGKVVSNNNCKSEWNC